MAQADIVDVTDAYTLVLTNEAHTFPGTTATAKAGTATTQLVAFRGSDQVPCSVDVGAVTAQGGGAVPTGVTVTKDGDATAPTLTVAVTTAVTAAFALDIPVVVNGDVTIHKVFSAAVALTGATGGTGSTGAAGKGISGTAITYQAGASGTAAPTGAWSATVPSVSASQYLWTRTVITYTDSTSTTSYSVGMMGATGATGATGSTGATGAVGATGATGADALSLVVTSSAGTVFKNSNSATTLTAHVFKGGTELTGSTSPALASVGTIRWYKDGGATAVATGQTLAVSAGAVTSRATYVAQLEG